MTLKRITAPGELALSLEAAKAELRMESDETDQDSLIESWIAGITDEAEHYTGRAMVNQEWRLKLDAFTDEIKLPKPPVTSILCVKYYDPDGILQTLDPAKYELDKDVEPCILRPAIGEAWPSTYARTGAVIIDFACGYGADDTAVPAGIKLYIQARLAEQFKPDQQGSGDAKNPYVIGLLDRFRVWG
jgi:uncharacterized phiE125 gp8 family phage protein